MTDDQLAVYNILHSHIFDRLLSSPNRLHFLTSKAGHGKSFIVKVLISKARGTGHIAVVSGTTALSVSNVDGGRTAHSMYWLPVSNDNSGIESLVDDESAWADFLCEAAFIMWDELLMIHVATFEAIDKLLRHIMGSDLPFSGKIVIAIGDFHQVAPVVKGGGPTACFLASILSLPLWKHFHIHQLTMPMQNTSDPAFAQFVDAIGEDISGTHINLCDFLHHLGDFQEVQHRLYPNEVLQDPTEATKPPEKPPEVLGQSQTTRLEAVNSSSRMRTQGAHFASQNA